MDTSPLNQRQRSRRFHSRQPVTWTAWVRNGKQRLRCHTVDVSTNGARLKPRAEILPGTPVQVLLQPPEAPPMSVSAVVWRVDPDSMALMFLRSVAVQISARPKLPETGLRGWR